MLVHLISRAKLNIIPDNLKNNMMAGMLVRYVRKYEILIGLSSWCPLHVHFQWHALLDIQIHPCFDQHFSLENVFEKDVGYKWWKDRAYSLVYTKCRNNINTKTCPFAHDDVIKWKHFPRYWSFVRGIHRSAVNSPHKGQRRVPSMFVVVVVCFLSAPEQTFE